nr:hypothetical protein [Tanacetum cinerariifolium]
KFSAKGTKREVFRMPIPDNLITADIQGEPYYKEYREKMTKHKRYLAGEKGNDHDSPAPKPAKATKKSKPSGKKRELVTKKFNKPSLARRSKPGLVTKQRKPTSSMRSVDEFIDEVIPEKEPRFYDEEAVVQRALEESLKSVYDAPRDSEVESDEDVPGIDTGVQDEGQARPNPGEQDEGQAGPNPGEQDEGRARPNPDTSLIPPMTTLIIDLTSRPDYPNVHRPLQATTAETTMTTTTKTTHPPPPQPQQSTTYSMLIKPSVSKVVDEIVIDAVDWAIQALLWNRFRDLPEADIKEILHQRIWKTNSYKTHEDHMMLYEALEKSMNRYHIDELLKDLAEARKKKKKSHDSLNTTPGSPPHQPPPPPPPVCPSGFQNLLELLDHHKFCHHLLHLHPLTRKITTDTRIRPSVSLTPEDLHMDDDMAPDAQVHSFDDEDIMNAHIPKVNLWQDWLKPLEEDIPATPEPACSIPSSDVPVLKNNWASALTSTYSPPPEDSLLAHTYDTAMFMGCKGSRPALSISKMMVAYYPDVGLEQMVPNQMWIKEEYKRTSEGDRRAVRTHMWILSVVRIEFFSMYG